MEDSLVLYVVGSFAVVFAIILVALGLDTMIKIILGNYVLGGVCFAVSESIDMFISYLQTLGDAPFAGIAASGWVGFFSYGHATIVLLLYIFLLVVLYKKSTISMRGPADTSMQKLLYIFLVPLALMSIFLTLFVLLWGANILSSSVLQDRIAVGGSVAIVGRMLLLFPVWIAVHGILTLIVSLETGVRIDTSLMDFEDLN